MGEWLISWWERHRAQKQDKWKSEFLPEAMEIIEKPTSPLGSAVIFTVALIVLFFAGWAMLGRVDEVVTARGKIVNVMGTQLVQTGNGGVIKEICVKEGEHVEAGQELVVLDASAYEITLQETTQSIALLEYENELLQCLLEGGDICESVPENDEKVQIQKYVFSLWQKYESQKSELMSEGRIAATQVAQQTEILDAFETKRQYLEQQYKIINEISEGENTAEQNVNKIELSIAQMEAEYDNYANLYEAGAISRVELVSMENELELLKKELEIQKQSGRYEDYDNTLRLLEIENQIRVVDSEYVSQEGQIAIAGEQQAQMQENLALQRANFETEVNGIIVENQNVINGLKAQQEIQTIDVVEQKIIAPVAGTVKTLDVTTIGGVLQTAQQIATIVPDEGQMLAEIEVLNKDIGYIEDSQSAFMKLDTYNFQKYGKLEGTVVHVSPDALWNEQKGWVYTVKIAIDSEDFGRGYSDVVVGVGMEGTAEVKVSDRPIIAFFLEPLADYFDGSLKVR